MPISLFNQQPRIPCRVNKAHPLSAGLVFACYPVGGAFYDAISGQITAHPGTKRFRAPVDGNITPAVAAIGSGGTGGQFTNQVGLDLISGVHSIFVEGSLEVNASTQALVRSFESGAGNGFGLSFDDVALINNGFFYWRNNGNGTTSNSGALGTNSEQFTHRVLLTNDGTNSVFYAKGALNRTVANAALPTANTNRRTTVVGSNNTQGSGSIDVVLAWNRVLSLTEYLQIYFNPWQVFQSPASFIFFGPASGVQSFSYTASGGLQFGGTSARVKGMIKSATGGLQFAGTAAKTSTNLQYRTVTCSGGVQFGGTSTEIRGVVKTASGGIVFGGSAAMVFSPDPNATTQHAFKRGRHPRFRLYS